MTSPNRGNFNNNGGQNSRRGSLSLSQRSNRSRSGSTGSNRYGVVFDGSNSDDNGFTSQQPESSQQGGIIQHNTALPGVDNIEQPPPNRRFFPRRPVGSRPPQIINTIPSVVSSAEARASRASTVSSFSRPPTIRLRRLPSNSDLFDEYEQSGGLAPPQQSSNLAIPPAIHIHAPTHTRARSSSDPARHSWFGDPLAARSSQIMSPVQENPPDIPPTPPPKIPLTDNEIPPTPPAKEPLEDQPFPPPPPEPSKPPTTRLGSSFSLSGARSLLGMKQRMEDVDRMMSHPPPPQGPLPHLRGEYNQDIVDILDVLDPEVSTLSTLTNVQNSLFIPNLGGWINRLPTYDLSSTSQRGSRRSSRAEPPKAQQKEKEYLSPEDELMPDNTSAIAPALQRQTSHAFSITSNLTESHYAVLPHGMSISDWSDEDKAMLDDHVRHLLHSKREKFKRGWKGFKKYISKPIGFFVTLYATLITLFGLAWVLFLIGWIYVGDQQLYAINVIDHVLVALFAIVGDGLAPFRAVDTYHMIFIAHYHNLTLKLRKKRALPELQDHNDLPTRQFVSVEADRASVLLDLEQAWEERQEDPVLTDKQQEKFEHHSMKFAKSHTYYRPHETRTHYAFPVKLLITVTVLLDCHSMFQIALGGVTWGINYKVRPAALTAVILTCSICCNIAAGITISIGDRMTRKKKIIEQEFRQNLTEQAIGHVQKKKEKQKEKASIDIPGKDGANGFGTSAGSSSMSSIDEKEESKKLKSKSKSK